MASLVLNEARNSFPELDDVSDRDFALMIGGAYPDLLDSDAEFKAEYEQFKRQNTGFGQDFVDSFEKGLRYDFPSSMASAGEALLRMVNSEYATYAEEVADDFAEKGQEFAEEQGINPESWGTAFGSGAASLVPMFATGGGLGALGAGAKVAQAGVYGMTALQSFGGTFKQAKDSYEAKGFSEDEAYTKALLPAAGSAVAELAAMKLGSMYSKSKGLPDVEAAAASLRSAPARKAINSINKVVVENNAKLMPQTLRGSAGRVVKGGAVEGLEEAGVSVADSIIGVISYDPDITLEQAANAAWKNFWVGAGLGGVVGAPVEYNGRKRTAKQIAEVEKLRRVAPASAEKVEKRQYESLLPDDGVEVVDQQTQPDAEEVGEETPSYKEFLNQAVKEKKLPDWWANYESNLKFSDQQSVDQFIEDIELVDEMAKFDTEPLNQDGEQLGVAVTREGKVLAVFDSDEEAQAYIPQAALQVAPTETKNRIEGFKELTRKAKELEDADRESTRTQPRPDPEPTGPSPADRFNLAKRLGIPESELDFTGINVAEAIARERAARETETAEEAQRIEGNTAERIAQEREAAALAAGQRAVKTRVQQSTSEAAQAVNRLEAAKSAANAVLEVIPPAQPTATEQSPAPEEQAQPDATQQPEPEIVEPEPEAQSTFQRTRTSFNAGGSTTIDVIGAGINGQLLDKITKAVRKAKRRLGTLANLSEIGVMPMSGGAGLGSGARYGNTTTIFVDPARLEEALKVKGFDLSKAIEEEVLHNLDGNAVRLLYRQPETKRDGRTEQEFFEEYYQNIADNMSPDEKAAAAKLYGDEFIDDIHLAQEYVRQLIQKKHTKQTTEEAYRNTFIRNVLEAIRDILRLYVSRGYRDFNTKLVKNHLKVVEDFLEKARKADIDDAITDEEIAEASKPAPELDELTSEQIELIAQAYDQELARKAIEGAAERKGWTFPDVTRKEKQIDNANDQYIKFIASGKDPSGFSWRTVGESGARKAIYAPKKEGGEFGNAQSLEALTNPDSPDAVAAQIPDRGPTRLNEAGMAALNKLKSRLEDIGLRGPNAERDLMIYVDVVANQMPQTEVAKVYGNISKGRISQIKDSVGPKLRAYLDGNPEFLAEIIADVREAAKAYNQRSLQPIPTAFPKVVNLAAELFSKMPDIKNGLFRIFRGKLIMPSLSNTSETINIHEDKVKRDGYVNSKMRQAANTSRRLEAAVKKRMPKPTKSQIERIDRALKGEKEGKDKVLDTLPPDVAEIVREMRQHIDELTKYMIKKGWVTGDLLAKFEENEGVYVARTFRIFDEPNYAKNISPELINRAVNITTQKLIKEGVPKGRAEFEAINKVNDLIASFSDKGTREMVRRTGQVGKKDLSLFKKKNEDLPVEILELLGEYKDPIANYARTVSRMVSFIGDQNFLESALKKGKGKLFFEANDPMRTQYGANTRIEGNAAWQGKEDSAATRKPYSPLAGYYTSKQLNEALNIYSANSESLSSQVWRYLVYLNSLSKYMATLAAPIGHARNFISQPFIMMANGHNPAEFRKFWPQVKMVFNDVFGTDQKMQAYYNRLTELGLTREEAFSSELKKIMKDYGKDTTPYQSYSDLNSVTVNKLLKTAGKAKDRISTSWRAGDEAGKIIGFEIEKALLRQLPNYASKTDAEIEELAAQNIRAGYPTYSEISEDFQEMGRQPLVGGFFRFPYEIIRTQFNTIKIANRELKNGNVTYAMRRYAGLMLVTAGTKAAINALSNFFGADDEEQENVRSLLPDYERNSQLFFFRDMDAVMDIGKGELGYANLSYNNPYSTTTDPLAMLFGVGGLPRSESTSGRAIEASLKFLEPFLGQTILAQSVYDTVYNQDSYGQPIYNEEADYSDKFADIMTHIGESVTPSVGKWIDRKVIPAIKGESVSGTGETPSLQKEAINQLFGVRFKVLDYSQQLNRAAFRNKSRIYEANSIFNKVATDRGAVSTASLVNAYRDANESRFRVYKDIQRQVDAARAGGLSDAEIASSFKTGKMGVDDIKFILAGRYKAMPLSKEVAKKAAQYNHPIPIRKIGQIANEYNGRSLDE